MGGLEGFIASGNLRRGLRWRERRGSILRLPFDHLSMKITVTIKGRADLRPVQDLTRVGRQDLPGHNRADVGGDPYNTS